MGLTSPVTRCFPENYLTANPQLNGATYIGNLARSNYHGLQVSYTLRPTMGFSVQTTYSWAKSMQLRGAQVPESPIAGSTGGSAYTDPLIGIWTAFAVSRACIVCAQTAPSSCRSGPANSFSPAHPAGSRGLSKDGRRVSF